MYRKETASLYENTIRKSDDRDRSIQAPVFLLCKECYTAKGREIKTCRIRQDTHS